jgi:hypothetical protein
MARECNGPGASLAPLCVKARRSASSAFRALVSATRWTAMSSLASAIASRSARSAAGSLISLRPSLELRAREVELPLYLHARRENVIGI